MSFVRDIHESKNQLIVQVELLKIHANIERQPVSRTTKDMIEHCHKNIAQDPLVFPIKENPFKEKKTCVLL